MSTINLPQHYTFREWFMDLNRSYPQLIVPTPLPNQDWTTSALLLLAINGSLIAHVVVPLKQVFPKENDWRKWAMMFIQSIRNT